MDPERPEELSSEWNHQSVCWSVINKAMEDRDAPFSPERQNQDGINWHQARNLLRWLTVSLIGPGHIWKTWVTWNLGQYQEKQWWPKAYCTRVCAVIISIISNNKCIDQGNEKNVEDVEEVWRQQKTRPPWWRQQMRFTNTIAFPGMRIIQRALKSWVGTQVGILCMKVERWKRMLNELGSILWRRRLYTASSSNIGMSHTICSHESQTRLAPKFCSEREMESLVNAT